MNKMLIDHVSDETKVFKKDIKKVIESVFRGIKEVLAEEGKLNVHGFGTFVLVHRPERMARNPKTMEPYPIPAHNAILFKPSPVLKEQVQE